MKVARFLPIIVFLVVVGAHALYWSCMKGQHICIVDEQGRCIEDRVVYTMSASLSREGFERYVERQEPFLGIAYALAIAFAVYALMQWQRSRKAAVAGAVLGTGLASALWAGACFLIGCCGSPMLGVWLGLFGAKALGIAKPLIAAVTLLSVGCGYFCLRRRECCPNDCPRGG
ncbi:MAG: hypothetical protein NZ520_02880 [bacterium]|nr:hypothetical protein [bacterium]MDW8321908.1 hypothetical protein [Armatimonadota bacterium]